LIGVVQISNWRSCQHEAEKMEFMAVTPDLGVFQRNCQKATKFSVPLMVHGHLALLICGCAPLWSFCSNGGYLISRK